ncbi:hypothetical protein BJX63DRAFT_418701 [Aspergillus granulosus]|uniref:3-beta hydroxysteroid dehydrogenase/isomerase domain-containing protein n=1 Tax=Aspergillus granulosus TaxID=176169 RepID=A0ABR4HWH0_9EURO
MTIYKFTTTFLQCSIRINTSITVIGNQFSITGASGHVGFKPFFISFERGYTIRALVRKDSHVTDLQNRSAAIATAVKTGQLELTVVPDFLDQEAIFNALHGITVIIHIASPLAVQTEKYQEEIIQPAISMVTTFLEAAMRVPTTVRRVVITSSMVTLIPFEWNANPDTEHLYNPTDLNTTLTAPLTCHIHAYWISKALARVATHDFIQTRFPQFDYVNILAGEMSSPFPYVAVPVHVADVAKAHVDAVDTGWVPSNSEFILASDAPEEFNWDRDARAVARKYFGREVESGVFPMEGSLKTIGWRVDTRETERVFGWRHVSFEETMRALVEQYLVIKE